MLGERLLTRTGLLDYIKGRVADYCQQHNIVPIPVIYGKVDPGAKASFRNLPALRIVVWEKLSEWLSKESHYNRVWYVMHMIGHELKHYNQYHNQQEKRLIPRKELMPEDEAYMAGFDFANSNIRLLSKERINPIATCPKCLNPVAVNPRVRSGRCPHCKASLIVKNETRNWGKQFWTATKQERENAFKKWSLVI